MDWLTFVTQIVNSLAWPVVVLAIALSLRKAIEGLIPNIEKIKYDKFEAHFKSKIEEVNKNVGKIGEKDGKDAVMFSIKDGKGVAVDKFDSVAMLAELSPRSIVIESWLSLENAVLKYLRDINANGRVEKALTYRAITALSEKIESGLIDSLLELRNLRNEAVHTPNLQLTKDAALKFAETAAKLERVFDGYAYDVRKED